MKKVISNIISGSMTRAEFLKAFFKSIIFCLILPLIYLIFTILKPVLITQLLERFSISIELFSKLLFLPTIIYTPYYWILLLKRTRGILCNTPKVEVNTFYILVLLGGFIIPYSSVVIFFFYAIVLNGFDRSRFYKNKVEYIISNISKVFIKKVSTNP